MSMSNATLAGEISGLGAARLKSARHQYNLTKLTDRVLGHLADGYTRSCRMVSSRRRLEKMIVEFDVTRANGAAPTVHRYVGKVYKDELGRESFDASQKLWQAGFCPPSPFTVIRPIAYIDDQRLLLEETAGGRLLTDILPDETAIAGDAFARTAAWLARLHASEIQASSRMEHVRAALETYGGHLAEALPRQERRVEKLVAHALRELESNRLTPLVASHGDFGPNNVFIGDGGSVTVIDLDTFGQQEWVADVAYFLVQVAITGFFTLGSFAATAAQRQYFLSAYMDRRTPPLPWTRLALYMGMAFLQSLHYELCVFDTKNVGIIDVWLDNCERCLLDGELTLLEDSVRGVSNVPCL